MKKFVHLALAAALVASSAVGAVALYPTSVEAAVTAEKPWAILTYVRNGQPVGNTQVFCNSPDITWGDTTNYDYTVWTTYFMCP